MDMNSYTFLTLLCPVGKGRGNYATRIRESSHFVFRVGDLQIVRIKMRYPVHKGLGQEMHRCVSDLSVLSKLSCKYI